jgi:cytochrome c553
LAVALPAWSQGHAERFAAQCAACHGPQGTSTQALTPHLGGQPSFYAITQLFLFREGRRNDHPLAAAMAAVAKGMTDADLRGFSEAIAALPAPPPPAAPADAQRFERGAALAQRLHCTACHGADLAGGKQVPRLAGQREDYLLHALQGFRAATRVGYGPAMTEALAGTTPEQLEDLAHHLAHAGATAARP